MNANDEKELRRRLEALRLKHNDANELSLTQDCLFADLIATVEILARNAGAGPAKPATDHVHEIGSCTHCDTPSITDPSRPTKPGITINIETGGLALADPKVVAAIKDLLQKLEGSS
jgi:hypothetical protein